MKYFNRLFIYILTIMFLSPSALAEEKNTTPHHIPFAKTSFSKYWKIESESNDFTTSFIGDTLEIVAPKGLTLWCREEISTPATIEYDACVMTGKETDRLSDLNCFWMASDPSSPGNFWKNSAGRGKFLNCYGMSLYYLGYGGNGNSTTRFRRYDGDRRGIDDPKYRPAILEEYTDKDNLLKDGQWYHIKISSDGFRTEYFINGKRLVDFRDPEPLTKGYFGFRTTLSRTRITNFSYSTPTPASLSAIPLHWIGEAPSSATATRFGVPFRQGEVKTLGNIALMDSEGKEIMTDKWTLASWPDGSVKWMGVAASVPKNSGTLHIDRVSRKKKSSPYKSNLKITNTPGGIMVSNGDISVCMSKDGETFIDSICRNGLKVASKGRFVASTVDSPFSEGTNTQAFTYFNSKIRNLTVERQGDVSACVKAEGIFHSSDGRELFPFIARIYFGEGIEKMKIVYSFIYDGDQNRDFIKSMGLRFNVGMNGEPYNRHVAFSGDLQTDNSIPGVWSEPIQPVVGRRVLQLVGDTCPVSLQKRQMAGQRLPEKDAFDPKNRQLLDDWAIWDSYRLSQLTPGSYTVRKRANSSAPWIGTFTGTRSNGYTFIGSVDGGIEIGMEDFWQSCPSSVEITGSSTPEAQVTVWLWSPESEPMDLRHYDNRAHGLNASYEDVQEGMSDPYGIAHTSVFHIVPSSGYSGKTSFAEASADFCLPSQLLPLPEYLHLAGAFGVWSLPDRSTPSRAKVEDRLDSYLDIYRHAADEHGWYGFWNYGDFMHAYDPARHEWMYDVGGFAWDNTELASPLWLWYSFLRRGDATTWEMSKAMTRHAGEVDVYHIGPNAALGSRHNVSHWGCGAKESRISQGAWNRFLHYLTADERAGDLLTEVRDADKVLYDLDPMRLAQPREQYPCTAPARLRIGPDWMAYAANWMTEWERTGNTAYRDKILNGMKSIVALPGKIFTGPLALGYDPETGIITSECDPELRTTNHLMTIMGGFEIMNELMGMVDVEGWREAWLDHADRYRDMAWEIKKNKFRVSRLQAYSAFMNRDKEKARKAWNLLFNQLEHTKATPLATTTVNVPEVPAPRLEALPISTNDAALWSLDAIYMLETIPVEF